MFRVAELLKRADSQCRTFMNIIYDRAVTVQSIPFSHKGGGRAAEVFRAGSGLVR